MDGEALHSATDSIKSHKVLPVSDELGGLKREVYGTCWLFDNKLYLHFAKDTALCGHNLEKGWLYVSQEELRTLPNVRNLHQTGRAWDPALQSWKGKLFDRGQHLCKYGLHAFKGSVFSLYMERERFLREGALTYHYTHMVGLREGMKREEPISTMVRREETRVLNDKEESPACRLAG